MFCLLDIIPGSFMLLLMVLNFQVIGVSDQAEKDEVVKSVINLKKADAEEGYTMEAAIARQVKTYTEFGFVFKCSIESDQFITRVRQVRWLSVS